jgi:hypothetical protein
MIGGQTLFTKTTEENFILAQNETNLVESTEVTETIEETVFIEDKTPQTDLKVKFARLKKAMRKRSASIF